MLQRLPRAFRVEGRGSFRVAICRLGQCSRCPPSYGTTRDADQSTNRPNARALSISARSRGFPAESRRMVRSNQKSSPMRPSAIATASSQAMTEAIVWNTPESVGQATRFCPSRPPRNSGRCCSTVQSGGRLKARWLGQRAGMSSEGFGLPSRPARKGRALHAVSCGSRRRPTRVSW